MKAWLNGPCGVVPLSTCKATTIGRECCDIIIPCPAVDNKHAIIEYDERRDYFVLRDLNTIFGTYINGHQVCNKMVRLTPRDVIKIGLGQTAVQYEFETESTSGCPCSYHAAEMLNSSEMKEWQFIPPPKTCLKTSFPHLGDTPSTASSASSNMSVGQQGNSTYPAYQPAARPFSARMTLSSMPYDGSSTPKRNSPGPSGQVQKYVCADPSDNSEEVLKKDRRIAELKGEVHRLRKFEVENHHKDCRVKEMTSQVECLHNQLSQAVSNASNRIEVEALQARIADLENQIELRTGEMADINEKMFKLKTTSQKQLDDKVLEINGLREELERYRKDKNILSGLLTQVQKDISMKDTTICRLTSDVERKKNELSDKDVQIASFQSSFCVIAAHKLLESDLEKMRGDLISVGESLKKSESSLKASEERCSALNKVMDKAKVEIRQEKQQQKDLLKKLDDVNTKQSEMNQSNNSNTQELKDLTSTLSRLRRRMQRLLSLRCIANVKDVMDDDDDDLTDDQIISKIKEIIEDSNNLNAKISDMNKKCDDMETTLKSIKDCGGKLKEELKVSTGHVSKNPADTLMTLRNELNTVQLLMTQPVLHDFRDIIGSVIQVQLNWQNEMVTTLENSGFNVMLSDVGLVKHVANLHSKSEESRRVQEDSKTKLEEVQRQFRNDLEDARDRGRREVEERSREKIERLVVESEMKIRTEKAVVEQKEREVYEEKVNQERIRIAQLEERLCCLQKENAEKSEELSFYKEQEKQHTQEVECYRKVEAELREEILARNLAKTETRSSIENSLRKKYDRETMTLREQNAHLSCTLASIQERLSKANNKIHRQQLEITSLKCNPSATGAETVAIHASLEVSRVNEKLRAEIRKHQSEIKKLALEIDQRKSLITEKEVVIIKLEAELQKAKENAENIQSQLTISSELAAVGSKCRHEKHVSTISKQKEALVELRKRMRSLQKGTAQSGKTVDDSHLTDNSTDRHSNSGSKMAGWLDTISKEIDEKATVIVTDPSPVASAPVEPAAADDDDQNESLQKKSDDGQNKDLKESLELSEHAYSSFLKAITDELPVGEMAKRIPSLTDQTTSAERREIAVKRQVACEEITTELSALKNKVTEYESTIEKYDLELMKLRNADVLLESKSWQIDGLTSDVRSLVDEVACLHESLTKVREELRREKRLNAAKGKKMCAEKDRVRPMGTIVKHTCFHNDSIYKPRERAGSVEKAKRRNYEIMLLEEEMKKCEKNMERARNVERMLADTDMVDKFIDCTCSKTSI